jgi:hypothetical protein
MPKEPQCKGTMILLARTFVGSLSRPGTWDDIISSIPPDEAELLGSVISIGWYPERLFLQILRALESRAPSAVVELAAFEAEQDLTVIHRVFLRLANPAYVLEKAGSYWARFHNTGEWHVERQSASSARGELRGWGVVDALACAYLGSYIRRMFELVGARDVKVRHERCRATGAEGCTFEGEWG